MKNKIKRFFKKSVNIMMVVGIILSSFSGIPTRIPEVHALASVSGDKIIETAKTYESYTYEGVGTCTGLVTRTLNKLGIGTSVVGIHPYDINTPQSGGGARYAPDGMYKNAINHPEDAKLIWQGYVKDIGSVASLLKNGDLVIQRIQDKATYSGTGHVGFLHKYGNYISMYGANGSSAGIGDAIMYTGASTLSALSVSSISSPLSDITDNTLSALGGTTRVSGEDYITVFRLTSAEPKYATLNSTKTATETVQVSFLKTDVETGKVLSGVEVDFYRDDVKFASGTTNSQGIATATSVQTYTATSSTKEYVTNYDELDDSGKAQVDSKGAFHYESDARASADSEAQKSANEQASKNHRYTVIETKTKTKYWLNDDNKTVSDSVTGSGTITVSLTNERVRGTAILQKVDYDVKYAQNEAVLDGAIYELHARNNILDPADGEVIYKAGDKITTVRTSNGGFSTVTDLYLGDYFWKEVTPSEGYTLNTTEFDFSLVYAGQTVKTVTSKSTVPELVITANFEIEKIITSGEKSEIVKKEEGAEFIAVAKKYVEKYGSIEEAYEHRNEFTDKEWDHLVTDKNGYAKSRDLAYGHFVVKQIKGEIDTDKVEDTWEFEVKRENQEVIKYIINNRIFTSYIKLVKKDSESGKLITLTNTSFKIKNKATGEILTQKVGETTYDTWKTDDKGYFVLPLEATASVYELYEIESPDLYVINDEPIEFRVTNSNIIETDHDGDPILTVTMYDKPVKGIINIEKHGEVLSGAEKQEDGSYKFIYEEQCQAGMTVEIVAREDITDPADGKIIYKKGTIVDIVKTGNTCENYSSKLPLGSYTVYETESPYGMVIDENKYDVDLTFIANHTEVVMETVSITNERQKVELDITKLDKDDETPIEGVIFNLKTTKDILLPGTEEVLIPSETIIEKATSDKKGKLVFNADLPLSSDDEIYFEISEEKTLKGYYESDEVVEVNTKYQGQNKKAVKTKSTIYNEAIKNYILVNKVDSLTMENIKSKDFTFDLCTDEECKNVVKTFNANQDDGTAFIPVTYNIWYIKESSAPLGYSLSEEVVKVELNDDGLFVNDNKVETDEDLIYSIIYQDSLLPVIQTGVENSDTIFKAMIGISIIGIVALSISLFRKKKSKED